MKRASRNHWVWVAVVAVLGLTTVPLAFWAAMQGWYPSETVDFMVVGAGLLVVSIALFLGIRGLPVSRWWWIPALATSPIVWVPAVLVIGFVLALGGVIPVP